MPRTRRSRLTQPLLAAAAAMLGLLATAASSATAEPRAELARPADAWLARVDSSSATLRWSAVSGATAYEVRRGGRSVGTVRGTRVRIRGLSPARFERFQVVAIAGATRSRASETIPVVTRAPAGCTHFVSSNGSDAGAGTAASPWRTITRLVEAWRPGWVGCVQGSFLEDVSIRRGGSFDAPVVLRSVPGTRATLRGRLWIASGADDVVVSGMTLDGRANRGATRHQLPSPTVNGNGAMILDNDISNAGTRVCAVLGSIRGYGTTIGTTLAYNRIHHCGRRGVNTHHGIYVESAIGTRIVHNVIYSNAARGIQLYPNAQRSLIMRNLIDGNGTGIIFSGAEGFASSRNHVARNVIANSQLRNNLEHYWEQPGRVGTGNVAIRNCLGGARQGDVARPVVGYALRASTTGTMRYRDRSRGDFGPLSTSGCRATLRGPLPLTPR